MRFETKTHDKYLALKLNEEKLDSRISPDLKSEFIRLHTMGVTNVILNLDEVKYVDSSGLSAILTANRLFSSPETNGAFVICHINSQVEKLIKISHLESVLNLLPTESEAIEAIFMHEVEKELSDETELGETEG